MERLLISTVALLALGTSAKTASVTQEQTRCNADAQEIYAYPWNETSRRYPGHFNTRWAKCLMAIDRYMNGSRVIFIIDANERDKNGESHVYGKWMSNGSNIYYCHFEPPNAEETTCASWKQFTDFMSRAMSE
jgi:hypothetical protein